MSSITDTFLLTGTEFEPDDNPRDAATFDKIQEWLDLNVNHQVLLRLDRNWSAYGGNKYFQASIWSGAFNYLDINGFRDFLANLDFPCWVQLVYQCEEDEGFTLVQIVGERGDE